MSATHAHPSTARRLLAIALSVVLVAAGFAFATPSAPAQAAAPSLLDGGNIISDAKFFDSDSMNVTQIQAFLVSKVSTCRADKDDPTCLRSFKANVPAKKADGYCTSVSKKTNASAAYIIYSASKACGISPKVILVMLQKEQGLITSTAPSSWAYRAAMGQSCPDTAPCDAAAAGFVNQVYLGARQMQVYTKNPTWFRYRAGQVNTIQWHPNKACGTSEVKIANQATANLYIYTPYRANVAALAAGSGTGDSCSAYGNRNFSNYYESWFGSGPAKVPACQQPVSADIVSASGTLAVTVAAVNVRTAPTLVCSSGLQSFKKGATVTVTGTYSGWTRAKVAGKTVWITSSALGKVATPAPAAPSSCAVPASGVKTASGTLVARSSSVTVRKAPTAKCSSGARKFTNSTPLTRVGTYKTYSRVKVGSTTMWVKTADVMEAKTIYTTSKVNFRQKATTSSKSYGMLSKGTKMLRMGVSGSWRKVRIGSQVGYIHADYLSVHKP